MTQKEVEKEASGSFRKLALFHQRRGARVAIIFCGYTTLVTMAIWLAYQLRFDFFVNLAPDERKYQENVFRVVLWILPLRLIILAAFRQYSGLLSYFGTPDMYRLAKAVCVGSALIAIVRLQITSYLVPPRGVILIEFLLTFLFLAGFRTGCRVIKEIIGTDGDLERSDARRTVIIGAGDVGARLSYELLMKRGLGRNPIAFFDDDRSKWNTRIHNIPVIGHAEQLAEVGAKINIEEVIIAMPSVSPKRMGEIVKILQGLHLGFVTVPSLHQMATGKVKFSQLLRPVEIQDLLGRESVRIAKADLEEEISNRVVLVTGAGGSIGSELCRQLVTLNPARLLMIDHSEFLLFEIEQELVDGGHRGVVLPLVGNILDKERMQYIFDRYTPEIVFHAAALKHVPMVEAQPSEAVKVNAIGTALIARLAVEYRVLRFVMISTDKAINPTSVMGATKRLAEMYIQGLNEDTSNKLTKFMAVRFGNVLGSSGSVIPTFKRQIAAGGPIKVTHPDVTRYFMTIPEAVGLVLQCGCQGEGGEIFVLDMGQPVKIVDLAKQLVELSGLKLDVDIEMTFIGLRPGEKLYEELQHPGESFLETKHPKVMRFVTDGHAVDEVGHVLDDLRSLCISPEESKIKERLKVAVPEYTPFLQ